MTNPYAWRWDARFDPADLRRFAKFRRFLPSRRRHPVVARVGWGFMALLMFGTVLIEGVNFRQQAVSYQLSPQAESLVSQAVPKFAQSLKLDLAKGEYLYNDGYKPNDAKTVAGSVGGPKFSASFNKLPEKGVTVTDPTSRTSVTFKPQFSIAEPQQDSNRLVYPLIGIDAQKVYSLQADGVKEDIILNKFQRPTMEFAYTLELSDGTEARMESDGSLGVYGAQPALLGNVAAASEKDQKLLEKARQSAPKKTLLFTFPAPYVKESDKKVSDAKAWFKLDGSILTLHASGLDKASYPLSIDPSVYIETASKLMRGNNETNIDFDVSNDLIQKSQTTGARIDNWTSTSNLSTPIWGQGTAAAGGYIYSAGGKGGGVINYSTYYAAGTSSFVVPTGVTSLTVKAWGGGGGAGAGSGSTGIGGDGGGGGFAKATITVTPSETLSVDVGSGGTKGASNTTGGNGGGFSALRRSATYLLQAGGGGGGGGSRGTITGNGGDGGAGGGSSGLAGTAASTGGGGGGGGTAAAGGAAGTLGTGGVAGIAGAANAGGNAAATATSCATATSGTGGAGGTGAGGRGGTLTSANCANGGGGGGGRFGGGGGGTGSATANRGGGGGGGGSSLVTGSGTVETAGSGVDPGQKSDVDRTTAGSGGVGATTAAAATAGTAGGVVISYTTGSASTLNTLSWAKFNSSTNAIESPNPGAGVCSGWCTSSAYNLPTALSDLSLIAYNGYLYAIGGADSGGTPQTSVYVAKLGVNGEPQLWHPTGGTPGYWYTSTALSNARSKFAAVAYNNHLYIMGGLTTSTTLLSTNTVQTADINPNGTLSTWTTTGTAALTAARYGMSAQVYNDTIYLIGGDATFSGTPITTVEYIKLNASGTMNSWVATTAMSTSGRLTIGGSFSAIWGGYVYLAGGCASVNASGYCTTIASDVQLASINADGTLSEWNTMLGLANARIGYSLIGWQGGLYRVGGCRAQNTGTGSCDDTTFDVDYGVINGDGDASTVATSVPSGTSPCSGASPFRCDLPGTTNIGNILNSAAIVNGYLYIIGGCTDQDCTAASGNTIYTLIANDGSLTKPATCPGGTFVDSFCVDSTNPITNGTTVGVAAAGTAVFNDRIYVYGGVNGTAQTNNVFNVAVNSDGSLNGTWTAQTLTGAGSLATTSVSYTYAYARANPASAGTNPGNFYAFGGCTGNNAIGCSAYNDSVYKCNILTTGSLGGCTTTGQLQIGTISGATGTGLAAHSGTVYANYIYLIGGLAPNLADLDTVRYAKFDNNNNVIAASGTAWLQSTTTMNNGRRRSAGFGYNGYIYVVGGFDAGTGILADIEFAQINVSDGSLRGTGTNPAKFDQSSVSVNQRWGLTVPVSNSYAFVIGGCADGISPVCNAGGPTNVVQTFQLYNNDSGALRSVTAGNTLAVDRIGGSSTVMNGYIYYAGGCSDITCTTLTKTTFYAPIDVNGVVGTWAAGGAIPGGGGIAWGKLVNAGGTLYYIGGQTTSATTSAVGTVYYTSGISSGNPTWNGTAATRGIGNVGAGDQARTQIGAAVWDNMIFVTGGFNAAGTAQSTVYASPLQDSGGNITTNWTSTTALSVARGGHTAVVYANNLYILGGYNGTNYLNDTQYTQINLNSTTKRPDGTVDAWTYSTSLPNAVRDADGFVANGYVYLVGGRTATSTCAPSIAVAPISANTTIASGNNPTGFGEWFETSTTYAGDRYGAAATYNQGRLYVIGGGCSSVVTAGDRMYYATLKSQPQVAKYSRMIDTDTDVFPTKWLMNGLDNSTGARWQLRYRSMHDLDSLVNPNEDCGTSQTMPQMTTWGQETNVGSVTLGTPGTYTPKESGGGNINCARYFYFTVSIDAAQTFGYPDDVSRGPTIDDLSLFFTADPSKRLMHGRTFTGGQQQPLDTPF